MKRILFAALPVLLVACGQTPELPSAQVMKNAAEASALLQSADMEVEGTFAAIPLQGQQSEGDFTLRGRMQDAGNQLQFALEGKGTLGEQGQRWSASADVIVLSENETYLNLHALDMSGGEFLNPTLLAQFQNKWWRLGSNEQKNLPVPGMTPDPRLLSMIANVTTVTKEYKMETVNGRSVYHYDVVMNPEGLLQYLQASAQTHNEPFDAAAVRAQLQAMNATGELWIDAETFAVHSLQWIIHVPTSTESPLGMDIDFTVTLSNHNAAAPIAAPQGAEPFVPSAFLQGSLPAVPDVLQ